MGVLKPTAVVESDCAWHIACSDQHLGIFSRIVDKKVIYQLLAVSLPLEFGGNCNILEFTNTILLIRNHTNRFNTIILKCKHIAPFQITIYHRFLFVGKQQQVDVLFLIVSYLLNAKAHVTVY